MRIALIGYRGTGKSAVARRLAILMKMNYVGMDAEIERRAGMTINEIVKKHGWQHFRDLESQLTRDLEREENCVIDTGGGVVTRQENIESIKKNSIVIWLQAEPKTIASRLTHASDRPSLTGEKSFLEEIEDVLRQRTPLYSAAADFIICTENKNVEDVVRDVVAFVQSAQAKPR